MSHLTPEDFEARYRTDPDPWGYETSAYEAAKYERTLAACGGGPFARGLELGASIGVLSAQLAPRCGELVTVDAAPTAVAAARRRLAEIGDVDVRLGTLPEATPDGPFDLVLASEILYYLEPDALSATLARLRTAAAPRARFVAVHWRPPGPERPFTAAEVHERLRGLDWLSPVAREDTDDYLLDVLEVVPG